MPNATTRKERNEDKIEDFLRNFSKYSFLRIALYDSDINYVERIYGEKVALVKSEILSKNQYSCKLFIRNIELEQKIEKFLNDSSQKSLHIKLNLHDVIQIKYRYPNLKVLQNYCEQEIVDCNIFK